MGLDEDDVVFDRRVRVRRMLLVRDVSEPAERFADQQPKIRELIDDEEMVERILLHATA